MRDQRLAVLWLIALVLGAAIAGFLAGGTLAVWLNGKLTLYDLLVPLALALGLQPARQLRRLPLRPPGSHRR
jgi:hypothetical protein